jgi:glutamyl-tRNA reductase
MGRHPAASGLFVIGVSHHTAPVAVREALAIPRAAHAPLLRDLKDASGSEEVMAISTCNRVELYGVGDAEAPGRAASWLVRRAGGLDPALVYRHEGEAAIRHAFRVMSGLDSMIPGDQQISGQAKDGYASAQEAGTLGARLGSLRNRSLHVAKRVRTETEIGRHATSVSHVAVELARKMFGSLSGRRVLLVGAGEMSRLAAERLLKEGALITVLSRTEEGAHALADALGGRAAGRESLADELGRADIVVSGTSAPVYVITRDHVSEAQRARGGRPLFLIDIAVPRDVDPAAAGVGGVFLYGIDDLQKVAESNVQERRRQAVAAEALVEGELRSFMASQRSLDAVPLLLELRGRGDEIRRAEIDKARPRLGTLSPEQERALEAVTAAIVNKLLHPSTVCLKQMAEEGCPPEQLALVRAALGLRAESDAHAGSASFGANGPYARAAGFVSLEGSPGHA